MIKRSLREGKVSFGLLLLLTLVLISVPLVNSSPYVISIVNLAMLFAVFAASWDLVSGYTGQMAMGQALFVGIGGYSVGLLAGPLGFPVAIAVGVIIAVVFALIVGIPCLRLSGSYLSITTLVMPLIMERLVFTFRGFTGGEFGIPVFTTLTRMQMYYMSMALMLICVFVLLMVGNSRTGKVFLAIKSNELGAAAAGNNIVYYKLKAFVISAALTSLAGGFLAIYMRQIGPGSFALPTSLTINIMGILGGMGTIIGPVFSAFGLTLAGEFLRGFGDIDDLIFALVLILTIMLFPKGIAGLLKSLPRFFEGRTKGGEGKNTECGSTQQEFR